MTNKCPDQLRLPFVLWTREALVGFLKNQYGIEVSVWTAGRYLKAWGFSPQKPVRRAYEKNPELVQRWLDKEYPRIQALAKKERAEIHWGDEMGIRSDHQAGRSFSPVGQTPAVPGTGRRFGCNMISTVTNRGVMAFMVFQGGFSGRVFLKFIKRLLKHRKSKIFLIVDGHPAHKAGTVKNWIKAQKEKLRVFFLPPYSPELNPDELLNQDVKANAFKTRRPAGPDQLASDLRSYLRSTQKRPDIVRNYFNEKHVSYAASM